MRRTLLVLVVVLVFAGFVPAAGADSDARPFKGSMTGVLTFELDSSCPIFLRTNSAAVGTASHLGLMTMTASHCTPPGTSITGGEMVLVAANGDEVYATYAGEVTPPGPDGVGFAAVDFDIVGGSDRFMGASGAGEMTAWFVWAGIGVPEWPAGWAWEGTIGY